MSTMRLDYLTRVGGKYLLRSRDRHLSSLHFVYLFVGRCLKIRGKPQTKLS